MWPYLVAMGLLYLGIILGSLCHFAACRGHRGGYLARGHIGSYGNPKASPSVAETVKICMVGACSKHS